MSKKRKIILIVLAILVIGGGTAAYLLLGGSVERTQRDTSNLSVADSLQTTTSAGIQVSSIEALIGKFVSVADSSELFFQNGKDKGTSGKFKSFEVVLEGDGEVSNMSVTVNIDASSLFTYNNIRDGHLKGEEFFHTEKYPKITFKSSAVYLGDTSYAAKGVLDFHGHQVETELPFNYIGKGSYPTGQEYHVIEGKFYMDLAKYGMDVGATIAETATISFYLEMVSEAETA